MTNRLPTYQMNFAQRRELYDPYNEFGSGKMRVSESELKNKVEDSKVIFDSLPDERFYDSKGNVIVL